MTRKPAKGSFGWWLTTTQRAHRSAAPAPVAPGQRRPFSQPQASAGAAAKSATVLPFPLRPTAATGSTHSKGPRHVR